MRVGYDPADGDPERYADLDEYLCEYVDGEMDPAVRAAFEEYLRTDPALTEHVECLRATRAMLCAYRCRIDAPCGLNARLRNRLSREMMQSHPPLMAVATRHLGLYTGIASVFALVLMAGLLALDPDTRERIQPHEIASSDPVEAAQVTLPRWAHHNRMGWYSPPQIPASTSGARLSLVGSGLFSTLQPTLSDSHQVSYAALQPSLQRNHWVP